MKVDLIKWAVVLTCFGGLAVAYRCADKGPITLAFPILALVMYVYVKYEERTHES